MTVRELIERLLECDQDAIVERYADYSPEIGMTTRQDVETIEVYMDGTVVID